MDTEQQVRLNFLEEVEDYFDRIEGFVLTLAQAELETEKLDAALRAAHSVKGGAAMMSFPKLSQVAHYLEDFFKILRVRGADVELNAEVESLFLRGVDALRLVTRLNRQGQLVDDTLMQTEVQPTFAQLRSRLGELRPEDEERLLAQEENVDVATIVFSGGVEDCLDYFEQQLNELQVDELQVDELQAERLATEITTTAEQLSDFGRMSELDTFVQLCDSVQAYVPQVAPESLHAFAQEALATWRRCHALVLIGRTQNLPHDLTIAADWFAAQADPDSVATTPSALDLEGLMLEELNLAELTAAAEPADPEPTTGFAGLDAQFAELSTTDLASLQEFVGTFGDPEPEPAQGAAVSLDAIDSEPADLNAFVLEEPDLDDAEVDAFDLDSLDLDTLNLRALELETWSTGLADEEPFNAAWVVAETPTPTATTGTQAAAADAAPDPPTAEFDVDGATPTAEHTLIGSQIPLEAGNAAKNATIRVATAQLQTINSLFGKLIVERNAINLRLNQLQSLVGLMQDRMIQLEHSNQQLRRWYDRASLEGIMAQPIPEPQDDRLPNLETTLPSSQASQAQFGWQPETSAPLQAQFDALELDRYTDLHILSQEQMERIVQLQEVSSDILLSLREASAATSDLNYTTRALRSGMNKVQMRPFGTLVKRFPRVIRDLAVQYDKQVNLKLEGETTLIDRIAVEALVDPLNQLVRNAFDHGIETPAERLATGKAAQGTITIRALHRGNQALITVQDDGRGLDPAKIRRRLRHLGLAETKVQQLSDRELFEVIFEPGFSTAEAVTELSGRGVGMDIVKTNLQQIRGQIRVDTRLGWGTTFTIQVPLAVAVLRVMLVESAQFVFAIPIDSVRAMISPHELAPGPFSTPSQRMAWGDRTVKLVQLADWLQFKSPARAFELDGTPTINQPTVLIIDQENELSGLSIDRFWGEQEISLSPLKSPVPLPPGIAGTSILGDGRVIPLVDPFQLLTWIAEQQAAPPLPALELPLPDPTDPIAAAPDEEQGELPTLLIVDDSINVRRYLAMTLGKAGYQVEQAKDGQDAIDKLFNGLQVAAMVCDIEMPRLDGYGVLSEVRSQAAYQDLPIVMLTSRMNEKHRKLALNLGASAYFSKPYNEQELLKTLRSLLSVTEQNEPQPVVSATV